MKTYTNYAPAALKRKRNEITIFDIKKQKYKNVKVWRKKEPWEKVIRKKII